MKTMIAPLAAFAVLGLGVGAASAASPSYCALFAKEFVEQAAKEKQAPQPKLVHDRAYHKCLNLDNEPPLPSAYADPATDGHGRPFILEEGSSAFGLDEEDKKALNTTAVAAPAPQPVAPAAPSAEQTAALQPDATPDQNEAGKPKGAIRSWMAGFLGKFRRTPPPSTAQGSVLGDRGLAMTASERTAWCAEHFPKSFDRRTGTVIPYKTGVRTKC